MPTLDDIGELSRDATIDHFRVIRAIGRGGMGEVYLARDNRLGRRVALKLINPGRVKSQEAVERFLFEARATAKFNHPNIVTIYAAGEFGGRPYVALEYIEGQDLRHRLKESPPSIREAERIGLAVARALAEAHRHGLLHRDLKPGNVLIANDGSVRVVDFGLAKAVDVPDRPLKGERPEGATVEEGEPFATSHKGIIGSPPYMAPEQWLWKPVTPATDIWSLGVVMHEMVTGKRPYGQSSPVELARVVTDKEPVPPLGSFDEVPSRLAELINSCLSKKPEERPTAERVVSALEEVVASGAGTQVSREECPFPGLLSFSEEQAALFHGRSVEIATFVERLRRAPVLPVVGPSGVGKTSFIRAGVVPRLREQRPWVVLEMRPGPRPFHTLAARLATVRRSSLKDLGTESTVAAIPETRRHAKSSTSTPPEGADPDQLEARLRESPTMLGQTLRELADLSGSHIVLFVDQLEELFVQVEDQATQSAFVRAICGAADDRDDPVRVVFAIRDDSLVRLEDSPEVRSALRALTVLRTPGAEALRETLAHPVKAVGYAFEDPGMVDEMVQEVSAEMAGSNLPLLQFAARLLWERRDRERNLLLRAAYEEIGGVAGALATHADEVLQGLSSDQRSLARDILLRLVTPGGARRSRNRGRLLGGMPAAAGEVLDRLTRARLIGVASLLPSAPARGVASLLPSAPARGVASLLPSARDEPQLALVHESLIQGWPALSRWIQSTRHELARVAELEQAAELWDRRGRRPEEVWRGAALMEGRRVLDRHRQRLGEVVELFVRSGEAAQRAHDLRRKAVLGGGAGILVLITVAAVIVAWVVTASERRARRSQRDAERQRAQALREGAASALERGEALEARAKLRVSLETEDSTAGRALWRRMRSDPRLWRKALPATLFDAAVSHDGKQVAAAGQDRTVYLIEAATQRTRALRGHGGQVRAVAFSPTGGRLAAGTRTGKVWLWDLRTRTKRLLTGQGGAVRRIRFGPRGRQLATASWDHLVRIWSLKGDAPVAPRVLRGHADRVYGIDFSPDGRRLASGSYDKTVRIWDLANGARALRTLEGHTDRVLSVSFSPDGKLLASGSQDGTVRLWDLEKGKCRAVLVAHTDGVREVRFSRDGKVLASAGADRVIHLWDPFKGEVTHTLTGHGAGVTGVDFSPDGTRLASTSFDKTVRLWDLTAAEPPRGVGHTDRVNGVAFSPDGKLVVSASSDRTVRIWDVKSGAQRRVIRGHRDGVIRAVFSPDGKLVASAGWSKVIRIWDVASGGQRQVLVGHRGEVEDMLFSPGDKTPLPARRSGVPDGQRLVTASWDRTIRVWKVESGALERELRGHEAGVRSVDLAPDGDTLASGSGDGSIRLWSVASGRQKRELKGHESTVTSVSFGPGGARLASGSYDGTVRLWDIARGGKERSDAARGSGATHVTARGTHRIVGRHEGRIYQVSFHTSGKLVGSAGSDSVARLWDLERGSSVVLASHAQTVNGIGFDTSGELAATVSDDGSVRLWRVATGAPVWRAAVYASTPPRIHTHRGWVLGGAAPAGAPGPERVISATPMASGGLCVRTDENRLQVWEGGKRLLDQRIAGLEQVTALGESCVVLAKGRVQLYRSTGWFKDLRGGVSAISVSDGTLILATNDQLLVFDGEGGLRSSFPAPPGVSALARTRSGRIALGFEDGGLTATARRGKTDGRGAALAFDGTSATAVTRLLRGPRDTIIAGHADGLVGIWLEEGGPRLDHVNMHGPVVHLSLHRGRAYVVTDLGDHRVWDLRPYFDDYCTFLRAVWRVVPVVWEQGTARLREPPADHRCALSSRRGS